MDKRINNIVKLVWIENEIDVKYINYLAKKLVDSGYKIYYRPDCSIYDTYQSFLDKTPSLVLPSINKSLEYIRSYVSVIVTGYNLNKYNSKYFETTRIIQLGHSHLGPVRYNDEHFLKIITDDSFVLVPNFYYDLFPSIKKRKYHVMHDNYYKNIYHIDTTPRITDSNSMLILPHWSTKISDLEDVVKSIRLNPEFNDNRIIIKLHPNIELELNKTKKFIVSNELSNGATKSQAKNLLADFIARMKLVNCDCYKDSELSMLDAIDTSYWILSDGASSSVVEAMIRSKLYYNNEKKFLFYSNEFYKKMMNIYAEEKLANPSLRPQQAAMIIRNKYKLNNWIRPSELELVANGYNININELFTTVDNNKIYNSILKDEFKSIDMNIISKLVPSTNIEDILSELYDKVVFMTKDIDESGRVTNE